MYHRAPIQSHIDQLATEISKADDETRLALQPEFGRMLETIAMSGNTVPARLRNLNDQLLDEAIEARFDNLPI